MVGELAGSGVVVHAAADTRPGAGRGTSSGSTSTAPARCSPPRRQAGVKRFVHVSTEAVLADGNPLRHVDETAPYPKRHAGEYARTKALAEQLVLAANSREMRTVAVRPRLVWGPGDTTVLPQILEAAQAGQVGLGRRRHYLTSTCHVLNVCEGIECAAERGKGGQTYFLTDGAPRRVPRASSPGRAAAHGVDDAGPHRPRTASPGPPRWRSTAAGGCCTSRVSRR